MIKLYIKQAFYQLRENRLISLVSIIGTALAICMIMVIVLVLEVRITDCVPEVNRSRSLYMKAMSIHQKGDTSDNSSNGCMSLTVAKECFKALTVPEAVTIVSTGGRMRISVPAGKMMTVDNLETDLILLPESRLRLPIVKADFLRLYLVLLWPGICLVR